MTQDSLVPSPWKRILWVGVFGASFGYVEAAVVVYLRALYSREGIAFPLQPMPDAMVVVEAVREAATLVMLIAVGILAGRGRWERFGAFLLAFGVWDITYYVWLKVTINWPSSLFEWDVLFLLPLPWLGPVIAAVAIALIMVVGGGWLVFREGRGMQIAMNWKSFVAGAIGTAILLYSFMYDTGASLHGGIPRPYPYWMLVVGLISYAAGFVLLGKKIDSR